MRVKTGNVTRKRHKKILATTKGMRDMRSKSIKRAKEASLKAGANAYKDRRRKKRDFRGLWNIRIGAAAKLNGTSYSKLIGDLKKENILLDRKVLAKLASDYPNVFTKIIKGLKK
jgi:large subunit ribosomal protein L20